MKKCPICTVAAVLAGVGALNWIFVVYFNMDLVSSVFGSMTTLAKIVYTLVGISGAIVIFGILGMCPCTKKGCN